MFPQLPQPPQVAPAHTPQPPPQMPQLQSSTAGQAASGIAQGLQSLVQNYMQAKEAKRKQSLEKAMQGMQLLTAGIPIDQDEVLDNFKKAGLKFAESPDSLSASRAFLEMGQQQPQMSIQSPTFGEVDMTPNQGGYNPPQGSGPGQLPLSPKQYLSQVQQRGQQQQATQDANEKLKQQYLGIVKAAIGGDPQARTLATRMKIGPNGMPLFETLKGDDAMYLMAAELNPNNPIAAQQAVLDAQLFHTMGGPQLQLKKMELAKELAPRFGNDLQQSTQYVEAVFSGKQPKVQPQMTFEELYKVQEVQNKLHEQRPTAPLNLIHAAALAATTPGQQETANKLIATVLDRYPSAADIAKQRWTEEFEFEKTKHKEDMAMRSAQMGQTLFLANRQYAFEQMKEARLVAEQEFDDAYKIWTNPKISDEAKKSAVDMMVDALKKKGYKAEAGTVGKWFQFLRGEEYYPQIKAETNFSELGQMPNQQSVWQRLLLLGGKEFSEAMKGANLFGLREESARGGYMMPEK